MFQCYWLSFADPNLPTGTQFLGACLVEASDFMQAHFIASMAGLNPGGEVVGHPFETDDPRVMAYVGRLMSRAEIDAMDAVLLKPRSSKP